MAFFEAAVVIYLRQLYYPQGFSFPLVAIPREILIIEICREAATVLMLFSVAAIAARNFWERFGYFIWLFGIWDIFFYFWLKISIGWPSTFWDWDILFLIPTPWIGPVIAPLTVSAVLALTGLSLTRLYRRGYVFRPTSLAWILALSGTAAILFSFVHDTLATVGFQMPKPYYFWLLIPGIVLYIIAYSHSYRRIRKSG